MKGKNLVSINDLSREEVTQILETAEIIKLRHYSHEEQPLLKGKVLGMIFQKPSLRTRVSFEAGMIQLGGQAIYLGPGDIKLGEREATKDIARVLSRYVNGIMVFSLTMFPEQRSSSLLHKVYDIYTFYL